MYIKYAIRGILREKIFSLLLILQLVCAFYALYNTLEIKSNVHTESSKIYKYFEGKKIYNLQMADGGSITDLDKYPKVNEDSLKKTFDVVKNSSTFSFSHQVLFPITIEVFEGHEDFKFYPPENNINGKIFYQAKNITLDEKTLDKFNLKLKDGRFFSTEEYDRAYGDNNSLPIIVGSKYSKYLKVGDEITYFRPKSGLAKAKVIGILEENQFLPVDMMASDFKRYVDLDNTIVTTHAQFYDYKIMYDTMFGYNFMYFDENTPDEEIVDVNNKIKRNFYNNLGINVSIKNFNKYIKAELDTFKSQDKIISITSITIFLFISITLIISRLNSILKRKKEFAIHIFCGGTMRDIAFTIYLESLLILMSSLFISLAIIYYQEKALSIENIFLLFLNLIFVSIMTTILPILKLLKLGVPDIMKEVG